MSSFFDYPSGEVPGGGGRDDAGEVFLAEASERDWEVLLSYSRRRRYGPGDVVIAAGAPDRALYLVVEGSLEVLAPLGGRGRDRFRPLGTVVEGSVIGEMSFFDGGGRSAVVRATSAVEIVEIGLAQFAALAEADPGLGRQILFDLGRILARRLRTAQASLR
ncbi:MAG: Crp/Fnr family transcriptional regulator [Acidimicrobiales bacterium]